MRALAAGKHVLVEKPAADTAEETKAMFELAERKGLVLLEAFHFYVRDKKTGVENMYGFADAGIDAKGEKWWMTSISVGGVRRPR
ncbi:hypothetical protein L208DRAFT_1397292 [Tricholoma matsutake]|nr:hypothetical protein L208DRAFT_1397292 [Tricholoma matsutake 945]